MQSESPNGFKKRVGRTSRSTSSNSGSGIGAGDAASVGLTAFNDEDPDDHDTVLVLPGDAPLLQASTIAASSASTRRAAGERTLLVARLTDPTGYGRLVRGRDQRVARIVDQRDATPEELKINEVCTSIYCFRRNLLGPALRRLSPENAGRVSTT